MTDVDDPTGQVVDGHTVDGHVVDGRSARRQRNVEVVLDVVLEMFAEEAMFPTIEQVATRSGLSLRSLYRYFADPGELLEAAITRSRERNAGVWHVHHIGRGPLDQRIRDFVGMRVRGYEEVGSMFRATVANAVRHARIRDELDRNRDDLRRQFELQFATELDAMKSPQRTAAAAAGDLVTQLDSIDYLRRHRRLSVAETEAAIAVALDGVFAGS